MTVTCDHGVALRHHCVWCYQRSRETRRTLGRLGPVLILAACVLAALYVVFGGNR